jgi:hypothetical protein
MARRKRGELVPAEPKLARREKLSLSQLLPRYARLPKAHNQALEVRVFRPTSEIY